MNWILLLAALTTTRPTTMPAAAINPLVPRPMSSDYSMLLTHSMFVRGHVAIDTHREGIQLPTVASSSSGSTTAPSLAKPEDMLVFNGVTVANGVSMAFIEDTSSEAVQTVGVGESIAQGKITDITLDTLTYRNSKHAVQLHIGQNLSGNDAIPTSAMPTSAPADDDSVAGRMRRKRQQELLGH